MQFSNRVARLAALAALPLMGFAAPALAQEPTGTWMTQSGDTRVRIAPCGSNFCGTIVWVKNPGKDEFNPDASKRSRNLVGIQMVSGLKANGDGTYTGSLYRYTDGKTFTGKATPKGNSLLVSGCVLGGLICQSQTWTKVN